MNITMMALGSRGDVYPYAAMGKGLVARGHTVRFATFALFRDVIEEAGMTFVHVRGDIQSMLRDPAGRSLMDSGQNPLRMADAVLKMLGVLADGFAEDFSALLAFETDLIINQLPGGLYGTDLAEALSVPQVLAAVMPLEASNEMPLMGFPRNLSFIPGYNRLTHFIGHQVVWLGFGRAVNRWRKNTLSLPPITRRQYNPPFGNQSCTVLNAFSPFVVVRPADWGPHVHMTGYWYPEEPAWEPPDALTAFLEEGDPPVFIGFGSMAVRDPDSTTGLVLTALQETGLRAILHAGWGDLGRLALSEAIFPVDYVPYGWLFPRMAAVVHHGGAGTTAFALRAGVPSLVVPFLFDQYFWGQRTQDLGVGPASIPQKRLTEDNLAASLRIATKSSSMRRRAAELGKKLQREDGIQQAIDILELSFEG